MSDDKITISMDEVNRANPVPGAPPSPFFTPSYEPPESGEEAGPRRIGLFIGLGIAAMALLCITIIGGIAFIGGRDGDERGTYSKVWAKERTVADFRKKLVNEFDAELAKPNSTLRKRIENAHVTVKVTSTEIVRCDVATVDGTERAGRNDDNIDKVSLLVRFNWKGLVDTGFTDLRIVHDFQNRRTLKSEIEYTTALVNAEDPEFWWNVGAIIGTALMSEGD